MGYDISTVRGDKDMAAAFAKAYNYTWMFNNETGEYEGTDQPYFRANIWGMGTLRQMISTLYSESDIMTEANDLAMTNILETLSWNDGKLVSPSDCELIISLYDEQKVLNIAYHTVLLRVMEDKEYLKGMRPTEDGKWEQYEATVIEAAEGYVSLLKEFISYLEIAKELDGCLVY